MKDKKRVSKKGLSNRGKEGVRQGEWAELRFMSEATRHGLITMKPWTRGSIYDVVIGHEDRFERVQVKSASTLYLPVRPPGQQPTIYVFNTCRHKKAYRESDFDFYALYVIPRDMWYIIPHKDVGRAMRLCVYPDDPGHRFERYREAWHLLQRDPGTSSPGLTIHACVEETPASLDVT
jgi:hypothetical protein